MVANKYYFKKHIGDSVSTLAIFMTEKEKEKFLIDEKKKNIDEKNKYREITREEFLSILKPGI